MQKKQFLLPIASEITVDLFAGGGGWSSAYELATGQHVHVAVNHDPDAISMHEVNHPQAKHYKADVFEVCPHEATGGMPVGWLHLSPDCTHHSQAKGGQPRDRKIRALAWVGARWAGQVRPRIISLENVKQILNWGSLVAKRDKATGRVLKLDGTVAEKGERVPLDQQFLIPDPKKAGQTWKRFVSVLRNMGYTVEWRRLVAADYGAPTTRDRLFLMARCDGMPIEWPLATHFENPKRGQLKWRSAAECIDWSIEGKSIFNRKRPLAEATMRRVARGVERYVINNAKPFIVPVTHQGQVRVHNIDAPLKTVTGANRGELMLGTPVLVQTGYGERDGQAPRSLDMQKPLGTVVAGGTKHAVAMPILIQAAHGDGKPGGVQRWGSGVKDIQGPLNTITATGSGGQAVATAFLAQMNGGFNNTPGHSAERPMTTVTNTGSQQQLVTAHLAHLRGNCDARDVDEPLHTISAGGQHHATVTAFLTRQFGNSTGQKLDDPAPTVVAGGGGKTALTECVLSKDDEAGALRVAAFLIRYYSEGGQWGDLRDPIDTITTRDRLALVTVYIKGTPYVIVDIKLRMLEPRELYAAQGFHPDYIITHGHDGRKFSKSAQVKMVGNSVSPHPARALIEANWKTNEPMRLVA
ncbi:DNA cytosine methyltransferase [Pusillimonas noertemannii]|uniref:DNA (cytosine-5-)-methyltransferase n=1 Tax=Pusillimonas noertemannii TaxID=305977 RepID=A0A2U1CMK4_9BURK|nr:DNA cytosine methyltransferase [Pusillimonas noertemannii]NYT68756.1 DNA cytosine methyltransferase [Pusillimonas noertemannii]PVY62223.1 DNA (cytosine-5)-methyltransferase 1 [Pusillimonas noertemannii]TFL10797.1 DNA cytosine methyltransferase [Pusillimonas noertemannii]